jgi:hypothetical protein
LQEKQEVVDVEHPQSISTEDITEDDAVVAAASNVDTTAATEDVDHPQNVSTEDITEDDAVMAAARNVDTIAATVTDASLLPGNEAETQQQPEPPNQDPNHVRK